MGVIAAHADRDAIGYKLHHRVFHARPFAKLLGLPYTYWVWDLQNVKNPL
jgi:hypothetical protein